MSEDRRRDWQAGTWEGSRNLQIRRNLDLTPRQRLECMLSLNETAQRLIASRRMPRRASETKAEVPTVGDDPAVREW